MQIGMIGLGKMGGNMSRRLMKAGHQCVVYARTAKTREELAKDGAAAAASIADLVKTLKDKPRAIWLMLPAGEVTEEMVEQPLTTAPSTTGMHSDTMPAASDRATDSTTTPRRNLRRNMRAKAGMGSKAMTRRACLLR